MKRLVSLAIVCGLLANFVAADEKSAEVSLQLGIANLRAKKFKEACEPLEAAFQSAAKDRTKIQAAEAMMVAFRETRDVEKYLTAADFVITKSERKPGRSVTASQVYGFVHFNGKTDEAIQRYENKLKTDPNDLAALSVLELIYRRSAREKKSRAEELAQVLATLDKKIATGHAQRLEEDAAKKKETAAWNLKDAAQFWLEAGDAKAALAAAKASANSAPEARSQILTLQWREGLGDLFLQTGEPALAAQQFEAAIQVAPEGILKTNVEKKRDQAKAKQK